jgi:GNAT superfamily N-acetyltransferase
MSLTDDLILHPITSLHDDYLLPWLDLYETAFPQQERAPVSMQLRGILDAERREPFRHEAVAALDRCGQMVGMAQWMWFPEDAAAYLGYFAILPAQRSHGLGSLFYRLLFDRIAAQNAGLLAFDVEPPEYQSSPAEVEMARRRIGFYQRLGAGLLRGVDLVWNQPAVHQFIMVHPIRSLPVENILSSLKNVAASFDGRLEAARAGERPELVFFPVDEWTKIHHNST